MAVVLVCNFDGNDGDTSYTPEFGSYGAFNFGTSTIELDTAIKKFGTAALSGTGSGFCTLGSTGDFDFLHDGSIWTIELWVYIDQFRSTGFSTRSTLNNPGIEIDIGDFGRYSIAIYNAAGTYIEGMFANGIIGDEVWTYLRITHDPDAGVTLSSGTTGALTQDAARHFDGGAYSTNTHGQPLSIGGQHSDSSRDLHGWIGGIRITEGEVLTNTTVPTAAWDTTFTPEGWVSIGGPLASDSFAGYGFQDLSNVFSQSSARFAMDISGTTTLRVPISSWQGTLSDGIPGYLQAVIPNSVEYEAEIATRLGNGETFSIYRLETVNGVNTETLCMSSVMDNVSTYRGPFRASVVLAGYPTYSGTSSNTRTMTNIRTWSSSSTGKYRARCDIDYYLNPGDTADVDGYQFTVDYINYYAPTSGDIYMDIGAR